MGRPVAYKPRRAEMTLMDLRTIKRELEKLQVELRDSHHSHLRLDILERFKKLAWFMKQRT
jgi:hypothetical protein